MEFGLVLTWGVALLTLWLFGLPLAAVAFPRWPASGGAFGLPVALVVLWLPAYWVGHLAFGRVALAAGLVVLVAGSLVALRYGPPVDLRGTLGPMAVFAVAFLFVVAVRAVDPAVHPGGGEKFLDFGLLKSLLRAGTLPPQDVWFAGEPVKYYYGGHLLAALLTQLTGTAARYAYNLALAGFYAALVSTAYGLSAAIADRTGRPATPAGLLGAFLVGVASNLFVPLRELLGTAPAPLAAPLADLLAGGTRYSATQLESMPFSYWSSSRVIEGTINEFPLFAWLNGDLHAHMMSTPFLLLAAALGFAYYRSPADARWRRRGLVFGALPALAGLLAVVNTWSFASVLGLTWLALTFATASPASLLSERLGTRFAHAERGGPLRGEAARALSALGVALVVLVLGVCWSLPFWLGSASGRELAVVDDRSPLVGLLVVHGGFLVAFVPYLALRTRDGVRAATGRWAVVAAGLAGVAVALGLLGGGAGLVLVGPLAVLAWALLRERRWLTTDAGAAASVADVGRRPAEDSPASDGRLAPAGSSTADARPVPVGYETLLVLAGLGLVGLVELVYVQEDAGPGRFNTVFKTYMQVWVLWGPAAAVALVGLLDPRGVGLGGLDWTRLRTVVTALFVVALVGTTSIYGAFALQAHFTSEADVARVDDPTLDALAFVETRHPEEAAAIHWLDDREGQPHIVSAPGTAIYRWVNAPSSLTGLPTVAGWVHEVGYRSQEAYDARVAAAERVYLGTPAEQVAVLREYDVRYVYVGPLEQRRYAPGDLSTLPGVRVAFREGAVTVYAVDHSALSVPDGTAEATRAPSAG